MASLVSTGQITIVDNNDAKPITAYITSGTKSLQQIYTKNDTAITFNPDRTTETLILSAKVFIGKTTSADPIQTLLTTPKWSYNLITPVVTGGGITVVATTGSEPTFSIAVNTLVTASLPNQIIYFEGDYTDPATGLVSHVIAQTTLSLVQTGSNAVYVQFGGSQFIEQSSTSTKKQTEIKADLMRSSGIDTDNLAYKWFMLVSNVWTYIDATYLTNNPGKFGFRTTTQANADNLSSPTVAMLNQFGPASAAGNDAKGIVIDESAIQSMGFFKVDIYDSVETKNYSGFFTIQDTSDPYAVTLISTSGEKLQNGVGTTDIYPIVYYGGIKVTDLTSWVFNWKFWSQGPNGVGAYLTAFIDYTKMGQATGGRALGPTPNPVGGLTITYGGSAISLASGEIIKIAYGNGSVRFYEVASSTGSTVTIRTTATVYPYLNNTVTNAVPTANEFANGTLYTCTTGGGRTSNGANSNDTAAKITVSGDEIDVKGNIVCDANRP